MSDEALADRPISAVQVRGLNRVTRQMIDNNIRVAAGQPFDASVLRSDVATLYRLGQFATVVSEAVLLPNGTVEVVYSVVEQPIIKGIGFTGNKVVSDEELRKAIPLYAGGPRDDFLLEQSIFKIKELYHSKGNFLAEVTVDESRLQDTGILVFRIIEGPRVRLKEVEFVGNASFDADQLYSQIKTRTSIPIFRKGELDEDLLIDDVASLDKFYKDQGFIDVRIDRRLTLSADSKEAKVTFLVEEGRRYRLRQTLVRSPGAEGPVPLRVYSPEQIESLLVIRPGDWYTKLLIDRSVEAVKSGYLVMGYVDAEIQTEAVKVGDVAEVDLVLSIREGPRTYAGLVLIQGNILTKEKVIRRIVRIPPGRPLDGRELKQAEDRLKRMSLFNNVRITVQRPRPGYDDPVGDDTDSEVQAALAEGDSELAARLDRQIRDVLVEVKERDTGSINFGVGVGTDSGIFGEISIAQRNFDIADPPATLSEFLSGRAFRGAGQGFNFSIAPGTEVSNFSANFVEPHLFETDTALRLNGSYRFRYYDNYDEDRLNLAGGLSRRLGDLWTISGNIGFQRVELTNFDPNTPLEIVADQGPASIFFANASLNRTDTDRPIRPTRGTQLELSISQSYDMETEDAWTTARASAAAIFTVGEDYLGRRSTLRIQNDIGYIFSGYAPTYDRLYLGGRSFRGFKFRTVSPKSQGSIGAPTTPNDQPIGGYWLYFLGSQYELPIIGDSLSMVTFLDTGTVTTDVGFEDYRVSIGVGIRLYIPQLGPNPLAFDFAIPLMHGPDDEEQIFSFAVDLPF